MERLFDPEYVKTLSELERWEKYEEVKRNLKNSLTTAEEYERVTDMAIKELEL
nr:hypothetical protein [uncultured Aggregatibacter sp.]